MIAFEVARRGLSVELAGRRTVDFQLGVSVVGSGEPYRGAYEVRPRTYEDVRLETRGKTMADDVTVLKIPQFEVSNEAGGNTLILGDEYYGG